MKGIKRIIVKNVLSASGIVIIVLITNILLFSGFIAMTVNDKNINGSISTISDGFSKENNNIYVNDNSIERIDKYFEWAMVLDDNGNVIWNRNLPEELNVKYTSSDIASFSKWYLKDYPVNVWSNDCGLLVLGSEKNSLWKHEFRLPQNIMNNFFQWVIIFLVTNFALSIILTFISSYKFFKSLRKVADGVSDIANNKPVSLNIKGELKNLADDINKTSKSLIKQQKVIDKRDNARNNWIIGVSHDIRTPLSMIMGYSSTLENNMNLSESERNKAAIIRTQSEKIKNLVNDLNLTIKLEYEMQPLNLKPINICEILRKVCVDYLNNICDDKYIIDLNIDETSNDYIINGDARLIERVFNNLIGNSISHNENGCTISINVSKIHDKTFIEICDDGIGFTTEKLHELNNSSELPTGKNHGLGLFIVKQIVQSHEGKIIFGNGTQNGVNINIEL